jgi:hypothetical protein
MNKAWQDAKRRWPNEVTVLSPKQQEMNAFDAYNHNIDGDGQAIMVIPAERRR